MANTAEFRTENKTCARTLGGDFSLTRTTTETQDLPRTCSSTVTGKYFSPRTSCQAANVFGARNCCIERLVQHADSRGCARLCPIRTGLRSCAGFALLCTPVPDSHVDARDTASCRTATTSKRSQTGERVLGLFSWDVQPGRAIFTHPAFGVCMEGSGKGGRGSAKSLCTTIDIPRGVAARYARYTQRGANFTPAPDSAPPSTKKEKPIRR